MTASLSGLPTAARSVLVELVTDPLQGRAGLDLAEATALSFAVVQPVLARLEVNGLVVSEWERLDDDKRRPRRRYYRLSPGGLDVARAARAALRSPVPPTAFRPRTAGESS